MKNYTEVKEGKRMVNEAFKIALNDKSVKKNFMTYLDYCVDGAPKDYLSGLKSYGEGVFDDASPKSIQKALYKFQDINEEYVIQLEEKPTREFKMISDINEIWSLVSNSDEVEFSDGEVIDRIYTLLSANINKSNK